MTAAAGFHRRGQPRPALRAAAVVAGWTAMTVATPPAHACSCGMDPPGFQVDAKVPLPAGSRGVLYFNALPWVLDTGGSKLRGVRPPPKADAFEIQRLDGSVIEHTVDVLREPAGWGEGGVVAHGLIVRANEALAPGRYRFLGPGKDVSGERQQVVAEVGALGIGPTATVKLALGEETRGEVKIGLPISCSGEFDAAQRTVSVDVPDTPQKFREGLLYTTIVDGETWRPSGSLCVSIAPGDSWQGKGKELLYAVCTPSGVPSKHGLTPNEEHSVEVHVRAPGGELLLKTAPERFTLTCPVKEVEATAAPPKSCGSCGTPRPQGSPWVWSTLLLAFALRHARRRSS